MQGVQAAAVQPPPHGRCSSSAGEDGGAHLGSELGTSPAGMGWGQEGPRLGWGLSLNKCGFNFFFSLLIFPGHFSRIRKVENKNRGKKIMQWLRESCKPRPCQGGAPKTLYTKNFQ